MFEQNKENIKVVFKNMPLSFHKMADPAHRAAMAADMQGKFWEYHDRLFKATTLSPELLDKTAKDIGLDMTKFQQDRSSMIVEQRIRKDMVDAQNAGVTGTPTIFINGRKLNERSMQGFQMLIDEELAKAQK
ncbi:Thioredoxin [Desulfopila aestuarii DSM 18488]|uniref:Thioredoxin n=1 Tax=Desulfopila aestuarii DSM 18488 TaxID=1121416 RepID=A0A1M7YL52_9BACT|nr:Thioredoxin [Desulfopila aestuarii DSM 18488]